MRRRTYESLERPTLLGRALWVISQGLSTTPEYPEVIIFGKSSVQHLKDHILYGGEAIFRKALEQLYLSWIMAEEAGDTYFSAIPAPWQPCQWEVFSKGRGVPLP